MLPTTSSMLLEALLSGRGESGDDTWAQFDSRYRPVLFAFARKLGLPDEDARDVAQDVLAGFVEEYRAGKYDRDRGRLRSWLFTITRARVARHKRARAREIGWRGESALVEVPEGDQLAELWEAEWRRAVLLASLDELRSTTNMDPQTIRAFEALTLESRPAAEVAAELGMAVNSVYVAKFRTMEKLREILVRMEEDF